MRFILSNLAFACAFAHGGAGAAILDRLGGDTAGVAQAPSVRTRSSGQEEAFRVR